MEEAALIGLIGAAIGLVGVLAGAGAMIWGLGYFEYLGGKKRSTVVPISKEEIKQKLLELNNQDIPYQIKPAEETDLQVEWKIVDAKWYGIISKERTSETYRAYIVLDEDLKTARYCEETGTVNWFAGTDGLLKPRVEFKKTFWRGRIRYRKSWGTGYGIKEDSTFGKVYEYSFDIRKIREPIVNTVKENGWEFVPVVRTEHATNQSKNKKKPQKLKENSATDLSRRTKAIRTSLYLIDALLIVLFGLSAVAGSLGLMLYLALLAGSATLTISFYEGHIRDRLHPTLYRRTLPVALTSLIALIILPILDPGPISTTLIYAILGLQITGFYLSRRAKRKKA